MINLSKLNKWNYTGKLLHYLPLVVLLSVGAIMLYNTFAHPVSYSYDYDAHMESLNYLVQPQHVLPVLPASFKYAYNPPLYYYLFIKVHAFVETITRTQFSPYYTFRIFHILIYLGIAFLFIYRLLPKYIKDKRLWLIGSLLFAVVPNFYLSQLMVRADHLTLLALGLLFYVWYYYDFVTQLSKSVWRIFVWSGLLILLANSRHFAIVGFVWFFGYGCFLLFRDILWPRSMKLKPKLLILLCLIVTIVGSGYYYAFQYLRGSNPAGWSVGDSYSDRYKHYEQYRGLSEKFQMLGNLQFDKLFTTPNRDMIYGTDIPDFNAIDPNFFETQIRDRLDQNLKSKLDTYYVKTGNVYQLRPDLTAEQIDDSRAIIYSVVDYNNAYFPRLYGDMWADHWLYFSGKPLEDTKVLNKQIVLVLAIPFTLFYLGSTIYLAWEALRKLLKKQMLEYYHTASFLFLGILGVMTIYTNFLFSEAGKNSIVKFAYLLGYSVLPFLGMVEILRRKQKWIVPFLVYLLILLIASLPLLIY